jgi:hypothetical protein
MMLLVLAETTMMPMGQPINTFFHNTAEHQEPFYSQTVQALRLKILTSSCNELGQNKSAVTLANALGCKHAQNLQKHWYWIYRNSPRLDQQGAAAFVPCLQQSNKTLTEL